MGTQAESAGCAPRIQQISDSRRMPTLRPETTEMVAREVTDQMMTICALTETGMDGSRRLKPALSCCTPRPSDVQTPKSVVATESVSMASPIQPQILSPRMGQNATFMVRGMDCTHGEPSAPLGGPCTRLSNRTLQGPALASQRSHASCSVWAGERTMRKDMNASRRATRA